MRPSRKRAPAPAASCINWAKGSGRQAGAKLRRQEQRAVVRRRRRGLRAQDGGRERRQGQQLPVVYLTHLENTTLPAIYHALNVAGAAEVRTIEMAQGQRSAASSPGPSTTPSNRPPGQPNAGANPSGAGYPDGADKIRILPFNFHHLRYSQYGFNNKNLRLLVYLNSNNYFTE